MNPASLHRTARIAGAFYLVTVLAAIASDFLLQGAFGEVIGLIAVACYIAVTVLFYAIFRQISRSLAILALAANLVGVIPEALRWAPGGIRVPMVFHGVYCLLIGYLMLKSGFLPRVLGSLMVLAGLIWLLYLDKSLIGAITPWNTVIGLTGEALPCLWFLPFGLRKSSNNQLASAEGVGR